MRGGQITRNRTSGSGGGVYYLRNTFASRTISGGSITNNDAALSGGGIMLDTSDVTLVMSGGTISGNRAGGIAGGVSPTMGYGGGILIPGNASPNPNTFIMSGGTISGNKSANGKGKGVAVDRISDVPLFQMSGPARITPDNDVFIHSHTANDCYITVAGPLSAAYPVATIDSDFAASSSVRVIDPLSLGYVGRFAAAGGHTLSPSGLLY
jgi:hypothetical protein